MFVLLDSYACLSVKRPKRRELQRKNACEQNQEKSFFGFNPPKVKTSPKEYANKDYRHHELQRQTGHALSVKQPCRGNKARAADQNEHHPEDVLNIESVFNQK